MEEWLKKQESCPNCRTSLTKTQLKTWKKDKIQQIRQLMESQLLPDSHSKNTSAIDLKDASHSYDKSHDYLLTQKVQRGPLESELEFSRQEAKGRQQLQSGERAPKKVSFQRTPVIDLQEMEQNISIGDIEAHQQRRQRRQRESPLKKSSGPEAQERQQRESPLKNSSLDPQELKQRRKQKLRDLRKRLEENEVSFAQEPQQPTRTDGVQLSYSIKIDSPQNAAQKHAPQPTGNIFTDLQV